MQSRARQVLRRIGTWAFVAIPAVGVGELVAHYVQTSSVVPDRDWDEANRVVRSLIKPDDLVTFAPKWVDPIGREKLGNDVASVQRVARSDEARFTRAIEVSIRGAHAPELASWRSVEQHDAGRVTIRVLENPSPQHVVDDLVSLARPRGLEVSRDGAQCGWMDGHPQTGPWFDSLVPGHRFGCADGSFLGEAVAPALDYSPRRCLLVSLPQGNATLTVKFPGVRPGHRLVGHHALPVHVERGGKGAPVTLVWRARGALLGRVVHRDGDGWKPFEFDTSSLGPDPVDITAELSSPERRPYCFEATTRD